MRYLCHDKIFVRTCQFAESHILIVNSDFKTFPQQLLHYIHNGTTSQVIRACFEAKPQYTHFALTFTDNRFDGILLLVFVALVDALYHRHVHVQIARQCFQCFHIFGQTRTTIGEAGFKVIRRDI